MSSFNLAFGFRNPKFEVQSPKFAGGELPEVRSSKSDVQGRASNFRFLEVQSLKFKEDFHNIPCHSTTVERFVALTSIAATSTIGQENRHGWLLNKVQSCEKISSHPTKEEYVAAASAKRKLYDDKDEEKNKKK